MIIYTEIVGRSSLDKQLYALSHHLRHLIDIKVWKMGARRRDDCGNWVL
jgi:hypothetical protein